MIYYRSPVGLPMPEEFIKNQEYASPGLNRLLQEIAWETVSRSPLTGFVSGEIGFEKKD